MATFPLMSKITFPHKRNFDSSALFCSFCQRTGHETKACLATPTAPSKLEREPYFDDLISSPAVDTVIYADLSLEEALKKFHIIGSKYNENNPAKNNTDKLSLLKSKVGFWKAINRCRRLSNILVSLWVTLQNPNSTGVLQIPKSWQQLL